jgi:DNA-binding response OmpR family regulator
MIVDDDEDTRKVIGMALRPKYEVVEACDGLDALSKLDMYEPDFAILDIMMPLMDGYQLCEAIRRNHRFKTIQVLFLSAYGNTDNIKKGYAVGANLFLTKPVDPERILKNIDVTIAHEPPTRYPKRHTIEQIAAMENANVQKLRDARENVERPAQSWRPKEESIFDDGPAPAATPVTRSLRPADSAAPRTRLLMVDDDPELIQMLDLALRDQFEVTTASNGFEAIERMVTYQPDLMLIDVMMPKMNGYQLLQSIRRNAYFTTMPVVVLTAKASPKDKDYALKLGATDFMSKPFRMEELLNTLQRLTTAPGFRIRPKTLSIYEIRSHTAAEQSKRV